MGLSAAPIGLGTTKIGRNTDVKYPGGFQLPTDNEIASLFDSALELGVNLIDTAPAYGDAEARLGPLIEKHRDEIVLCTKAGEEYANGRSTHDFSAAALTASVERSLRRLHTDHVDILLLHSDGRDVEVLSQTDTLEALSQLKRSGKIRAFGISAKTAAGIRAAAPHCDVVMAPFSQSDNTLGEALAEAHTQGLGILAIKGLSSGHLAAQPAIEFVLNQPFIDTLVIGTLNPAHLQSAVEIARTCRK
jgi:aryl-alcohol dehydrogenase-like predicted oxidoreductase